MRPYRRGDAGGQGKRWGPSHGASYCPPPIASEAAVQPRADPKPTPGRPQDHFVFAAAFSDELGGSCGVIVPGTIERATRFRMLVAWLRLLPISGLGSCRDLQLPGQLSLFRPHSERASTLGRQRGFDRQVSQPDSSARHVRRLEISLPGVGLRELRRKCLGARPPGQTQSSVSGSRSNFGRDRLPPTRSGVPITGMNGVIRRASTGHLGLQSHNRGGERDDRLAEL